MKLGRDNDEGGGEEGFGFVEGAWAGRWLGEYGRLSGGAMAFLWWGLGLLLVVGSGRSDWRSEIAGVLAGGRFAVEAVRGEGSRVEGEISVANAADVPMVGFAVIGEGWVGC